MAPSKELFLFTMWLSSSCQQSCATRKIAGKNSRGRIWSKTQYKKLLSSAKKGFREQMKHVYAVYHTHKLSKQNNIYRYVLKIHPWLVCKKHQDISTVSRVCHKTLNDAKSNHSLYDLWIAALNHCCFISFDVFDFVPFLLDIFAVVVVVCSFTFKTC